MHSTDGPVGTTFHHNGDYSGTVMFDAPVDSRTRQVVVKFAALARAVQASRGAADGNRG